jgi:hypothetical protein
MEVQPVLTDQRTEIDIHGSPEPIPTRESLFLVTLYVPERVADVLEVESHTAFKQAGPLATPITQEMSVEALTGLMTVRAAQSFLLCSLGMSADRKEAQRGPH